MYLQGYRILLSRIYFNIYDYYYVNYMELLVKGVDWHWHGL